jgi:hypothetical protein
MSQSTSFPPPYSPSVGGIGSSEKSPDSVSFTPPDRLTPFADCTEGCIPSFSESFAALSGGRALQSLTSGMALKTTESDLQHLLDKIDLSNTQKMDAALACITAAPLPFFPKKSD